jgi:hypothetical protein
MKIYHYAQDTHEYLGESVVVPDPLEPGKSLIPRCATPIPPPDHADGFTRCFTGDGWESVLDRRGVMYWISHNDQRMITEIGEDVPEDGTLTRPEAEPVPSTVISCLQARLWIESAGWTSDFDAFVASLTGMQKIIAESMMYAQSEWRIDNPLIVEFLGVVKTRNQAEIQEIFNAAAQIDPWATT